MLGHYHLKCHIWLFFFFWVLICGFSPADRPFNICACKPSPFKNVVQPPWHAFCYARSITFFVCCQAYYYYHDHHSIKCFLVIFLIQNSWRTSAMAKTLLRHTSQFQDENRHIWTRHSFTTIRIKILLPSLGSRKGTGRGGGGRLG